MTDNEIVRALRGCANGESEDCPFAEAGVCGCPELSADLIERLTAERDALREKVPQWISVEDRLPEVWKNEEDDVFVNYMIYSPDFGADIGNYHVKAKGWLCMGLPCSVTHWMPLPGAPEG